jgi:hypothetical protein
MRLVSLLPLLLALPALARADALPGLYFTHADWELACDNTGTCRAAGYQADQARPPVSVLLTRKAGAHQPVSASLQLGQTDDAAATPLALTLVIDGADAGKVTARDGQALLPPAMLAPLLDALRGTARIEWRAGARRWRLSGTGAAAVLLKMDAFQGRVGTRGALIKPGAGAETRVPPATPAPQVRAVFWAPTAARDSERVAGVQGAALRQALAATLTRADDYCPDLQDGADALSVWRLDATRLLVSTRCWLGAYNVGLGFWVIDAGGPFNPVLVTTAGSEADNPSITAEHKGRGIGDCHSSARWTWDGRRFVPSAASTTGMCKLVAAGGAWELPRIVSDVRPAP